MHYNVPYPGRTGNSLRSCPIAVRTSMDDACGIIPKSMHLRWKIPKNCLGTALFKVVEAMSTKNVKGRDARRTSRREARLEEKMELNGVKKEPLLSPLARKILLMVLAALVVVIGGVWFYTDSQSYVAKVDGRRIGNAEYTYFLRMQQSIVESKEGLDGKTEEERKAFWAQDSVDGENPIQSVKKNALDNAREYAIQLQNAKDLGLSVDDTSGPMPPPISTASSRARDRRTFITNLTSMGLTEDLYAKILQNYKLIETFKARYLADNYKPAAITDDAVKAAYDKDPKQYDTVKARIIYIKKSKEDGTTLDDAALKVQKQKAEDVLAKIKAGEDMETLAKTQSETTTAKTDGGANDLSYSMQPYEPELIDWAFAAKNKDLTLLDTSYGFFVIRMEGRTGLAEAKDKIKATLEDTAKADFYNAAIDGWMKDAKYNVVLQNRVFDKFTVQ